MTTRGQINRRAVLGGAITIGATAGLGTPQPADAADRKVALITGTSSGFGRLTALTLARAGHHVFASMRNSRTENAKPAHELRAIARKEDLALDVIDIDTRNEQSAELGVHWVQQRTGRIDVLVNNAGTFYPAILETLTTSDIGEFFDTNVFGHLRMNRAVLPIMRQQHDGLIVQITTALGRVVLPFMGAYAGAKWAMEAMTEVSRYEVSQFGIDVVIVEPGAYDTDLVHPNGTAYYQRYLKHLSRDDARRRHEYGDLARRAESHLQEEPGPDPQEIADTVADIVHTPRGERPPRVTGPGTDFLLGLNQAAATAQLGLLEATGFGDLIEVT